MPYRSHLIDGHAYCYPRNQQEMCHVYYPVKRNAFITDYITELTNHKIGGALLVQPSILGLNHDYLLNSLDLGRTKHSHMFFRGVACLPPNTHRDMIRNMSHHGIIGARLNLLGRATPDFASALWQDFFTNINYAGWFLQLQTECDRLVEIFDPIIENVNHLVIEHFSLVDGLDPMQSPGFNKILSASAEQKEKLSITLTRPYRIFTEQSPSIAAESCVRLVDTLISKLGRADYLIWGSDWPYGHLAHKLPFSDSLQWGRNWLQQNIGKGMLRLLTKIYHLN